jgi:SAM-dependent methyltransferase
MATGILLIDGGDANSRRVYETEGRGDWARAFPLVLEKLGYLDFEVAGPDALADEYTWHAPAVLLVARLPQAAWSDRAIGLAGTGRTKALIELPPPQLHPRLGIEDAQPAAPHGSVAAQAADLVAAVADVTARVSTQIEPPQSRVVERDEDTNWTRLGVPITAAQAERWRVPGWDVERWSVGADCEALAEWVTSDRSLRWPAIISRQGLRASCFSLFAYLGQQTTAQPAVGSEYLNWARSTALEALLGALIDSMHREARVARARVLPWPQGSGWVLNVRHDYDRELPREEVQRFLAGHRAAGTSATWYWRARYLGDPERDQLVRHVDRTPGQEVAHHTEQLWRTADVEQAAIERAIGRRVSGTSAHGDPQCFRWQGAPNVLWADRQGLAYTEFISHAHLHPHRFTRLEADGTIRDTPVVCLPHHVSLDRSTTQGDAAADEIIASAADYARAGGMMQILNHPDLNRDLLFQTLALLPDDERLNWTSAGAVDWWRRTHVRDELRLSRRNDAALIVTSLRGVRGVVVEILDPDGRRHRHVLELDPGASAVIAGSGDSAMDPLRQRDLVWRREATPIFTEVLAGYYAERGIDPRSEEVVRTVATNTKLVPGRVQTIRRYLADQQGIDSLRGLRILDVGGGFGAFAVYLALDPDTPRVSSVDIRPDFVASASDAAARLHLTNLEYAVADVRALDQFEDETFNVVVLNNSFVYLPTADDMRQALQEIARVMRPNARVILFHANRWRLREPFTGAPIVHLLRPRLAGAVSRVTGWKHNHGRVRLISAPRLARELRRCGLQDVRTDGRFAHFYGVSARKPPRRS